MVLTLAEEELVTEKRESRNSDDGRRKRVGFLRDEVLCALVFSDREAGHTGAARRQRIDLGKLVEHVSEGQSVVLIEVMVNLDAELIGVIAEGLCCGEQIRADVRKGEEAQQLL